MNIKWDSEAAKGCSYCLYNKWDIQYRFYSVRPEIKPGGYWSSNERYFGDPRAHKWSLHERPKEETKMPEGATHELDGDYYKVDNGKVYSHITTGWLDVTTQNDEKWVSENFNKIKHEKEMIYTKEMLEAGELPKIGMIVEVKGTLNPMSSERVTENREVLGVYTTEDSETPYLIVQSFSDSFGVELVGVWDLSDTRTDKEKAIDDLNEFFSSQDRNDIFHRWSVNFLNEVESGKIHGITFTGGK